MQKPSGSPEGISVKKRMNNNLYIEHEVDFVGVLGVACTLQNPCIDPSS